MRLSVETRVFLASAAGCAAVCLIVIIGRAGWIVG